MTEDARFEDGAERPVRLAALDAEDLRVISALVQDSVLTGTDMTFDAPRRRFALLLNRFRWEDRARAEKAGDYERVRSLLVVHDVLAVARQGIDSSDADAVLSLLAVEFAPGADGTGDITLVFAGDGAVKLSVECVDVVLSDVTRPYRAPARRAPDHKIE
ncbi:MAG: DUF2948 family protein [Rhodobacteraceae bacterium]|nr:DUF2948 family protein [Paracoccaceae bacterium]